MAVTVNVRDILAQQKALANIQKQSEKALRNIISDARTRVPGWIATEVTKVYNIKKSEITPAKASKGGKSAGSVSVRGETIDTLQIVYKGRVLTPTHFGMTPKAPKPSYTLKAEIIKGRKSVLGIKKKLTKKQRKALAKNFRGEGMQNSDHSPIMLMPTGTNNEEKTGFIPFQRVGYDRKDIEIIRTISMPQMVSSERTAPGIAQAIAEGLEKRMEHHTKSLGR